MGHIDSLVQLVMINITSRLVKSWLFLPLKWDGPFIRTPKYPFNLGHFVPSVKLAQWFWRGRFKGFLLLQFWYHLLLKNSMALDLKNPNFLHSRMFCAKDGWNWLSNFLIIVVNVFLLFLLLSPLGKSVALHMNKFESPTPNDALCQVWL